MLEYVLDRLSNTTLFGGIGYAHAGACYITRRDYMIWKTRLAFFGAVLAGWVTMQLDNATGPASVAYHVWIYRDLEYICRLRGDGLNTGHQINVWPVGCSGLFAMSVPP